MFVIGEIAVDESIAGARFACDLGACLGACCTLPGGRGAPLSDDEVAEVEGAITHAAKYLSPRHLEHIGAFGAVEGIPGSYATQCIDDKDCVFVYYTEGVARCSIEQAYNDGTSSFRKPVSCHLFPIRVDAQTSVMRYEKIPECGPGRERGKAERIHLRDFLKEALVRKFGSAWYGAFLAACEERNGN